MNPHTLIFWNTRSTFPNHVGLLNWWLCNSWYPGGLIISDRTLLTETDRSPWRCLVSFKRELYAGVGVCALSLLQSWAHYFQQMLTFSMTALWRAALVSLPLLFFSFCLHHSSAASLCYSSFLIFGSFRCLPFMFFSPSLHKRLWKAQSLLPYLLLPSAFKSELPFFTVSFSSTRLSSPSLHFHPSFTCLLIYLTIRAFSYIW